MPGMILTDEARARFFRLRNPFLDFCRTRLPLAATPTADTLPSETKATFAVVQAVRQHPEIHDEYLKENPDKLGPADQERVRSWKAGVGGDFIVTKLLKKGAVLAESGKPHRYFLVLGITTPVEDFCYGQSPVMVKTNLLPFEDAIILDGFVELYNVHFGGGTKRILNEEYQAARRAGKIWSSLDGPPALPAPVAVRKDRHDWKDLIGPMVDDCERLRGAESETLNAAFSLLRASAQLTHAVVRDSDHAEVKKKLSAIRRAFTAFQNNYYA